MSTTDQENFSRRLRQALKCTCGLDTPYQLAREFNRHFGGTAVTVYAARKWLLGEAIPTQSKLRAMARWLGVSPEWLRYGVLDAHLAQGRTAPAPLAEADLALIADLQQLDAHHRRMAGAFIGQLHAAQLRRDGAAPQLDPGQCYSTARCVPVNIEEKQS